MCWALPLLTGSQPSELLPAPPPLATSSLSTARPSCTLYQNMPGGCKALCQSLSSSHSSLWPEAPAWQRWIKKHCNCRATAPPWPCTRGLSSKRPALWATGCTAWPWQEELLEPWVQLCTLLLPCCHSGLDLAAKTHPTSLKGPGLLYLPFQKSWALSLLLLLPAAHYHQSQPEVGLYINSTSIMLVASPHAPPAARDRHTQGSRVLKDLPLSLSC